MSRAALLLQAKRHWALVEVCPKKRTITVWDSSNKLNPNDYIRKYSTVLGQVAGFFDGAMDMHPRDGAYLRLEGWVVSIPPCPQQDNEYDSGVFTYVLLQCRVRTPFPPNLTLG